MKKLIFGLIATVFFGVGANAQKVTKEEVRTYAAKIMVQFKNSLEPAYNESKNFDDFIKNSTGPYNPQSTVTSEGRNILKVAYDYLSNKTSDQRIIDTYSGKEVAFAFKYLKENNALDNESILFGITAKNTKNIGGKGGPTINFDINLSNNDNYGCKWYQIRCWLTEAVGEVAADVIITALIALVL